MDTYEFHPFADAFPMMTDQEHAELVADIKAHGQREPITLYHDQILDGRNRYKACFELGIEPRYVEFTTLLALQSMTSREQGYAVGDTAALAFVISKNLVRRQLNESQRAMVAAKLADLQTGQRADQVQGLPIGRAAKMLNVGERSVARARKVIDKGDPELVAAVERGEIAVSAAASKIDGGGSNGKVTDQTPPPKRAPNVHVAEPIDASTLSMSAQDKLAAAIRQTKRKLDAEHAARLREVDEEIRLRVVAEGKDYLAMVKGREAKVDKDEKFWREMINNHKSPFTADHFKTILMCLHPDGIRTAEKLTEAFRLFNGRKLQLTGVK